MECIVFPEAQSNGAREALGRLLAASYDPPRMWPILATLPGGGLNPDESAATWYYCDPMPSADETEVAFSVEEGPLISGWLGQVVETNWGEITIPASTQELDEEWFPPPPPPPR